MAINVNNPALTLPMASPKFNNPTPKEPKITVKFNQDKKVLSLAKKTLGSTLAGSAILLFEEDIDDDDDGLKSSSFTVEIENVG